MYIRCWGSRGSIPVSGTEYNKYGGDTTCLEIRSKSGDLIIVDAGTGIRALGNKLIKENMKKIDILLTHAHWDHLMGFPFFKPIFIKGTNITVYGRAFNMSSVKSIFIKLMDRPYCPIQLDDKGIKANILFKETPHTPFNIGSVKIHTIPLSHPKDSGLGYRFDEDGKSFVFLTDNELGHVHKGGCKFEEYVKFCKGANFLIHDAQYAPKEYKQILKISEEHWGHSVIGDVIKLAIKAGVELLGLFHINPARDDEHVDTMVKKASEKIAKKNKNIKCFAVGSSFEITL